MLQRSDRAIVPRAAKMILCPAASLAPAGKSSKIPGKMMDFHQKWVNYG
jgi:hypothetical protein